jgi:hypothetical protein
MLAMCETFVEKGPTLMAAIQKSAPSDELHFTPTEFKQLELVAMVLQPLRISTKILEGNGVTACVALVQYSYLKEVYENLEFVTSESMSEQLCTFGNKLVAALAQEIELRVFSQWVVRQGRVDLQASQSTQLLVATLLWPSMKYHDSVALIPRPWTDPEELLPVRWPVALHDAAVRSTQLDLEVMYASAVAVDQSHSTSAASAVQGATEHKRIRVSSLEAMRGAKTAQRGTRTRIEHTQATPRDWQRELHQYLQISVTDAEKAMNPIFFWTSRASTFPLLTRYALAILSAPASSAASERAFSRAALLDTKLRSRTSSNTLSRSVFVACNWAPTPVDNDPFDRLFRSFGCGPQPAVGDDPSQDDDDDAAEAGEVAASHSVLEAEEQLIAVQRSRNAWDDEALVINDL